LIASAESVKLSRFFLTGHEEAKLPGKEVKRVTSVNLRPNESQDQLLKRFRKKVAKSGVLSTVRRKRWFVSRSELRRIQQKKSIRRIRRRQREEFE
jgi:small subunit ribosomal protein S21